MKPHAEPLVGALNVISLWSSLPGERERDWSMRASFADLMFNGGLPCAFDLVCIAPEGTPQENMWHHDGRRVRAVTDHIIVEADEQIETSFNCTFATTECEHAFLIRALDI